MPRDMGLGNIFRATSNDTKLMSSIIRTGVLEDPELPTTSTVRDIVFFPASHGMVCSGKKRTYGAPGLGNTVSVIRGSQTPEEAVKICGWLSYFKFAAQPADVRMQCGAFFG